MGFQVRTTAALAAAETGPGYVSYKPINPLASPNAKKTLQYLYSIKGNKVLSGMHNWINVPYGAMITVKNEQGDYPAVQDGELGYFEPTYTLAQYQGYLQDFVNSAITHFGRGGITAACWHMSFPGTRQWADGVQRAYTTNAEFDALLVPGSTGYKWIMAEIDAVAPYLKQLRDLDIPLILRPFHEMNGQWFWWGCKNNFVQLWDMMYDRLVNYHQCHNILWMWNWNAPNGYYDAALNLTVFEYNDPRTFAGVNKADIFGIDVYNQDYKQKYHDDLVNLLGGKLQTIGENGMLPTPAIMAAQPQWSWFATWTDYWSGREGNTSTTRTATFSDPKVLVVGEIGTKPAFAGYAGEPIDYVRDEEFAPAVQGIPAKPKLPGQIALHRNKVLVATHANDKTGWTELARQGLPILTAPSGDRFLMKVDNAGVITSDKLTIMRDSFNRADTTGNGLAFGSSETGPSFYTSSGNFNIRGNKLTTVSGFNGDFALADIATQDFVYDCLVSGNWSAAKPCLVVKAIGYSTDYFQITIQGASVILGKQDGGAKTTVASAAYPDGKSFKAGDEVKVTVTCKGPVITVYIEDMFLFSYTMTAAEVTKFQASTLIGIRHERPGAYNSAIPTTWDNLNIEKLI